MAVIIPQSLHITRDFFKVPFERNVTSINKYYIHWIVHNATVL